MSNFELKQQLVEKLQSKGDYFRKVNDVEYRTRCQFCGDSSKNLNTGHLYIRINFDDNFPMVYHCFKCGMSGIVNQDFLSTMDIDDLDMKSKLSMYNKHADNLEAYKFVNGDKTIIFDYTRPEIKDYRKIKYIEKRLGKSFTEEDIEQMKIITSLKDFLIQNDINYITCDKAWANAIEDHYIGFLTFGGSHIMFRDITETESYSWIKYPITQESNQCRAFYTLESEIDIFTEDKIIINMGEGILDILSVCYNLEQNNPNTLNIAVGGKGYCSILDKLLNMGFVGNNIILNIYADNDAVYNKKAKQSTTINYFKSILRKYKHLYGEVNIFYNMIGKDVGVPKEQIVLKKQKI